MKVLHLADRLHGMGPDERYLWELCRTLPGRGHQVLLVHGQGRPLHEPQGVLCHRVPELGRTTTHGQMWSAARLLQIIRTEVPDVVHIHGCDDPWVTRTIGRLAPTVKVLHDDLNLRVGGQNRGPFCWEFRARADVQASALKRVIHAGPGGRKTWGLSRFMRRFRERFGPVDALRAMGQVLVPTRFMLEGLLRRGFPRESMTVNPYGVRVSRRPVALPRDLPRVLFISQPGRAESLDQLLSALAGLAGRFEVDVISTGFRRRRAERLVRKLRLADRVRFTHTCPSQHMETFYRRAWVLAMPGLSPEPFGIEGLEAMARGRPVVAYDTGGISEWLSDGETGFLVRVGDIEGMRRCIAALLDDVRQAESMGNAAWERALRHFSVTRHLGILEEVYAQTAAEWRRRRAGQKGVPSLGRLRGIPA